MNILHGDTLESRRSSWRQTKGLLCLRDMMQEIWKINLNYSWNKLITYELLTISEQQKRKIPLLFVKDQFWNMILLFLDENCKKSKLITMCKLPPTLKHYILPIILFFNIVKRSILKYDILCYNDFIVFFYLMPKKIK